MTLKEWLSFGGNEVANNSRAFGYARSAGCAGWITRQGCATLQEALGDALYVYANITEAPWYDPALPDVSARFYGVYILDFSGLADSTREAQVTQSVRAGGQIGKVRRGTKETKVKAFLLARGDDAITYGRSWLDRVLSPSACGQHGESCGVTDVAFFDTCPPERGEQSDEEYEASLIPIRRYLHDVAVTSGPFTVEEASEGGICSQVVEWTFTSERPWVYGQTRSVELPTIRSSVTADVPRNLAKYPSAELTSGTVLLGTNLSTNPSVETGTTGWAAASNIVSGSDPAPYRTGVQSNDKAGAGTYSFRARILGNGSTEVASSRSYLYINHDVSLTSVGAGQRVSGHIWAAASINAGAGVSTIHEVRARIEWRNASSALGTTEMGILDPADFVAGSDFWATSIVPPAGATIARLQVVADVTWRSSATAANNSDIRIYADKATLSNP